MSSRYEKHTPVIQLDEITSAEETMLAELAALANSPAGQFIRKESGSLVNSTLTETIAFSGLSDVAITSATGGDLVYYNGTSWVNLPTGLTGYLLTAQGSGNAPTWVAVGAGTVTSASVVTANGVSASVATATTTPAFTFTLGAITPSAVQISGLTASEIVITDASKNLASAAVATYPSLTELTYVKGVTSAIQTQLNAKAASLGADDNYVTDAEKAALHAAGSDDTFTVANEATDTSCSVLFVTAATGDLGPKTNAGLTFNSNTGLLTATGFSGPLTGNVTGNASGTAATVTDAAQTAITSLGTLTTLTVDDITINGNTISSAGASTLAITPTAGQSITFDGTVTLDAGVVAGMTSLTMSGTLAMQANSITMTGSLAATGARVTKGWFTDLESTNDITIGGTALATTYLAKAGGTLTGSVNLGENAGLTYDAALSADGKYSGLVRAGTAGATLAFGDLIYLAAADSRWELADASAASTAGDVLIGICVLAAAADADPTTILLQGFVRADTAFPALTISAPAYIGETAGDIVTAQPTTTDAVIRRVGFAWTADELYFNPSNDYVTHI